MISKTFLCFHACTFRILCFFGSVCYSCSFRHSLIISVYRLDTIILHRPEDLVRLKSSIMVKAVLKLNGGEGPEASLLKFIPGRYIEVPELQERYKFMLDANTARHFFHSTQHYYAETIRQINKITNQLDKQLNFDSP